MADSTLLAPCNGLLLDPAHFTVENNVVTLVEGGGIVAPITNEDIDDVFDQTVHT